MEYGAHLPLIAFEGAGQTLADLRAYAQRAAALEYRYLCANDHLLFGRPWLDGPTALAATIDAAVDMTLATTVCLPVIRGPVQTAKALAAIDILSDGRLVAGVGPGSSPADYAVIGVPFEERWRRFDEAIRTLRSLLGAETESFVGSFYSTQGVSLEPAPRRPAGPPIWVASWGSPAGLRRVARLGDGWLASGYNTTPSRFEAGLGRLHDELEAAGGSRGAFPNAIATMWLYVSEARRDAERMLGDVLAPMLGRPIEALRDLALPIGSAEQCAERISAYREAGAERIFVWPLADGIRQLERFREDVVPLVSGSERSPSGVVQHAAHNAMSDPGEIARFHDRCSDLMRELLNALADAPDRPRTFPQIEDTMEWPRRRIASVLGGVSHLRHTEFGGRRPYRFLDDRRSASGRWEMWMDATQARAVRAAGCG